MNSNFFLAKRIIENSKSKGRLARPIIKVATLGIVLGMAVMILSISIGSGFQKEVKEKIVGFSSPIQVVNYDYNQSYETNSILLDSAIIHDIAKIDGVKHIQQYATKPGIIKTNEHVQGMVLKGVGADYDWSFVKSILVDGAVPTFNTDSIQNTILISRLTAKQLNFKVGDDVIIYFIQENVRARRLKIGGIFDSNLPEYDKIFAFVDIKHIQKLNNWSTKQVTGLEIKINDFALIDTIATQADIITAEAVTADGSMLRVRPIQEIEPQIFGWLAILDTNVIVIILLVLAVAGFNMISGLLILILERTNMIGILKALGMANNGIRSLFIYLATYIIGRGILWGNIIGISLCLIQMHFNVITLNPEEYYLNSVPINLSIVSLLILNIGTLIVTTAMMFFPTLLVSKILPAKSIKFE